VRDDIEYRPMAEADLLEVHEVNQAAFVALDPDDDLPRPSGPALVRLRRILETDPGGAWVAVRGGRIAGGALGILREGVWGLSLLFVDPADQSAGVGRELLRRARAYGDGARGWIILASEDPRALRSYRRLGLDLHPCVRAHGVPRVPAGDDRARPGTPEDLPFTEAVDRAARGAAHGEDILAMVEAGHEWLVVPDRGYVLLRDGDVRLLAAFDEAGAQAVLRVALARLAEQGGPCGVDWITARQQWAIDPCLDAGLALSPRTGAVFLSGDVGPFAPYLPSGAYL
jgi:GNAT superfamily N-acetyltransferase